VILCERGIRTFETATRFTLDLSAIPVIKKLSHLPIVVDPSHGVGAWDLVEPMGTHQVARKSDDQLGISMRCVWDYLILDDKFVCRFDVLYGWACVRPQLACRIMS